MSLHQRFPAWYIPSVKWLLCFMLLLCAARGVAAPKGQMLFVTSSAEAPINSDPALIEFFTANGYEVVLFGTPGMTADDLRAAAAGKKVVLMSESIGSTSVLDPVGDGTGVLSLKDTDVPIISFEAYMFDNADWVKRTADGSNDFAEWGNSGRSELAETPINDGRDSLFIRKADHPIAKGLTGKVKVYNELYSLNYGLPSADADVIASIQEDGTFPTLFVYEKGDKLVDGSVAPNKRIGLFLGQAAPGSDFNIAPDFLNLTDAGKQLILQTVDYASGATSSGGGGTTTPPPPASNILYSEDFNTDGEGARYTTQGHGVFPGLPTTGPAYWARNVEVTAIGKVVGVPAPAPAKRALIVFNHNLTAASVTPDALKLIDNTIKWLTDNKAKLRVLFSAAANPGEGDQLLVARLMEQGHTVVDDDAGTSQTPDGLPDPATVDLVINGSSAGEPARLVRYAVPMLSYRAAISGDLLLATRGETLTFDPGEIQIAAPTHPIAAGLPAKFTFVTDAQPLDTIGLGLPAGATTVATYQYTNDQGITSTRPFVVVIDKGVQMLGGLISGFDGAYWAGADLNEPEVSGGTFNTPAEPRSLTLKNVNVAGKSNVKLSIKVAATEVDFDAGPDDFFRIMIDTDGAGPAEFTALATFAAPSASEKFYTDGKTRISIVAKQITYDLPAGATDLVVRFESNSTFWNEIVAFDDVKIHTGDLTAVKATVAIKLDADKVVIDFSGVLQSAPSVTGPWTDVPGNPTSPYTIVKAAQSGSLFLRVRAQ